MEPIHWVFIGVVAWASIMGLLLRMNYNFHEWQRGKMRALFPKYGGRVGSKE